MDERISAKSAGYLELQGAQKDADCRKVRVSGGISKQLGCCNLYQPESSSVRQFKCGVCEYVSSASNSMEKALTK